MRTQDISRGTRLGPGAETKALRSAWSMDRTGLCNQVNMEEERTKTRGWLGSEAQERVWFWRQDLGVIYTEKEVESIHEYSGKRTQNKTSGKPDILETEKNVLRWGGVGWGVGG